jgi:[acyl-carrier-protein] S-malonyltransferase
MGQDVAQAHKAAAEVFEQANRLLGFDLAALCFAGPADRLNATDISQPAIFVTSVAIWRALEANGQAQGWKPEAMAGLSLGEYTALHLAGRLDFADTLRLVAKRGRLMQDAAEANPGGMMSIIGLDESAVDELCRKASDGEVLTSANFNCPGQIVISGSKAACERAGPIAEQMGARAIPLTVAGAFHSALMLSAAEGLRGALTAANIGTGRIPVVSNVSADYHADPADVRRLLCDQVVLPVRWQASIERLIADGFSRFVEVGPGRVLTGLMKKINRSVTTINVSSAAALEQVST